MASRHFDSPTRYDFKIECLDFDMCSVQRIHAEFGQYVSYDAYYKLLCAFSEYEDSREEEE
jgi:hypothetical protein